MRIVQKSPQKDNLTLIKNDLKLMELCKPRNSDPEKIKSPKK